ncbi:MAG TPA: DegT/DnrJ/EryC1/StrS family aminotransferase [Opitutaceae bacterium]
MSLTPPDGTALACLGGTPAFDKPLHVGRPNIGDQAAFLARTQTILDERYFTNNGPMVREFECRIAAYVGVKHCVAMCNATIALEIAMRALGFTGEVFSFHATKFLNSFEGGAVVTDDDELAAKMRLMRNFGFADYDKVIYTGTNGKMTEICAAMGLTSLEAIDDLIAVNRRNYESYRTELAAIPGLALIDYAPGHRCNFQYIVLEVDPAASPLTRDDLVAVLHAENILARKYFWPGAHKMEPYRSYFPNAGMLLPVTERLASRIMVLPTGQSISAATIGAICGLIKRALLLAPQVKAALSPK